MGIDLYLWRYLRIHASDIRLPKRISHERRMSIVDKMVAAVTPPESEDARREARAKAKAAARPGDWLSRVLQHHQQIEAAFSAVKSANTAETRVATQKKRKVLGVLSRKKKRRWALKQNFRSDMRENLHATYVPTAFRKTFGGLQAPWQ